MLPGHGFLSALNARATYDTATASFTYHSRVAWLPRSFESHSTWTACWNYPALTGCLAHARFDFPLQVHSILALFLTLCAVLFSLSRKS